MNSPRRADRLYASVTRVEAKGGGGVIPLLATSAPRHH